MRAIWQIPAALLFLPLCVAACREKTEASAPKRPALFCVQPRHDFGARAEGDRLSHVFHLENRGRAPLRLLSVDKSYSCAAREPPTRLEAGRSGKLEIVCDTDQRPGRMADEILVHTNDPRLPVLKLEVAARVQPRLAFEPTEAFFELAFGGTETRELRLTGKLAADARLTLLESDDPTPKVDLLPADPRASAGIRVTLTATRAETRIAHLRLSTGLERPKELAVTVTWRVTSDLVIEPSNPYFNLREPPPHERFLRVSSKRAGLKLYAVEVRDGPFEATLVRDEATDAYSVRVAVLDSKVPEGERGVLGKLLIASNDPAEPRKIVPLFALGILAGKPAASH